MKKTWEDTIDINYQQDSSKNQTTIYIDNPFIQPLIYTEQGQINAKIQFIDNRWNFTFGLDDIKPIDGISTYIYIIDQNQEYRLCTKSKNKLKNFNNIKAVWYTPDLVYYFRNTASAKGRLTLHRKERLSHESPFFAQKIRVANKLYSESITNNVLIYEKELMKFEESGARLFENIADQPNVYFVISKQSPAYQSLRKKYKKKIVTLGSCRYLRMIYTAKYYIGTELPMHLIGLRSPYKLLRQEVMNSDKHKFIFLQHGVTQALSLEGPERAIFRKNFTYSPYKVVVSSKQEAEHFITVGNYQSEDLWNIGLATFDQKQIDDDADQISIMLTWRPWDQMKVDFTETSYYQAILSIFNTIDDHRNLNIIMHPKAAEQLTDNDPLFPYINQKSINQALSKTSLLITDYSSVVFDAFYRGSNIIFWWNQKDECLSYYNNRLLITSENAFGDIVYNNDTLNSLIVKNYQVPQQENYIEKYRLFVEHHDNKNTERLITNLRAEKIIK